MEVHDSAPLAVDTIRDAFPVLDRTIDGTDLVYLDNAATSHTPEPVVEAIADYYRQYNANVHRGLHTLSQEASVAYETAHDHVAEFIGAAGREEIVFTKNTTEAENLVAYAWGLTTLEPEDTVVLTEMEHHASLVTWQQIADRTGADVEYIRITETGELDMEHARSVIGPDTAMVSAVHVSNTLGTVNPVAELVTLAHEQDALAFIDGAQAAPTRPIDVKEIGADFYAFSGHKMLGPTGIGVLYGREPVLDAMEPYLYGGEMIEKVTFEDATWNELPWKYEAGTPPIAQAVGLDAALSYLEDIGMDRVWAHEEALGTYAYEGLAEQPDVELYGPPPGAGRRGGLVAFNLEGVHAHDLAAIMDEYGVAVRAGDHCTQPLHDKLGVPASVRASVYVYNTREEVDRLIEAVGAARELFT